MSAQQPPTNAPQGEIRITFQDRPNESHQNASPGVETVISIADLKRTLDALQFGVWTTAAIESGRSSWEELSEAEKLQYTLVIVGARQGNSLTTDLMFLAAVMTAHSAGVLPHDVAVILEAEALRRLWGTLAHTIDRMNKEYPSLSDNIGQTQDRVNLEEGSKNHLRRYTENVARSARNSGKQILIFMKDPWGREAKFQTNREGNDRLLSSSRDKPGQNAESGDNRKPTYTYENGVIVEPNAGHTLLLQFKGYAEPTPCHIQSNHLMLVNDLVPGDSLTIYGHPYREQWDRPDSPPRSIDVVEIRQIHRNVRPRI